MKFRNYFEKRRLEQLKAVPTNIHTPAPAIGTKDFETSSFSTEAINFLREHDIATLSSLDKDNVVHGAVVYYVIGDDNKLYIVTKSETQKVHDVLAHNQIALTVYDAAQLQTIQLTGIAEIEVDQRAKDFAFDQIVRSRLNSPGKKAPPVTHIQEGSFMVLRITPNHVHYRDYSGA